jgi:glycine cleavage system regulatory protein
VSTSLVVLVIGPDRPGLVDILSDRVAIHGGSWSESRMAHLAGQFAGIVRVTVPSEHADALVSALEALTSRDLTVVVRKGTDDEPHVAKGRLAHLEVVGTDRPGIVQSVSHQLAEHGVNVEDLHTELSIAPMSGETLFRVLADLRLPEALDAADLRRLIEDLSGDLMVDLHVPGDEG